MSIEINSVNKESYSEELQYSLYMHGHSLLKLKTMKKLVMGCKILGAHRKSHLKHFYSGTENIYKSLIQFSFKKFSSGTSK